MGRRDIQLCICCTEDQTVQRKLVQSKTDLRSGAAPFLPSVLLSTVVWTDRKPSYWLVGTISFWFPWRHICQFHLTATVLHVRRLRSSIAHLFLSCWVRSLESSMLSRQWVAYLRCWEPGVYEQTMINARISPFSHCIAKTCIVEGMKPALILYYTLIILLNKCFEVII